MLGSTMTVSHAVVMDEGGGGGRKRLRAAVPLAVLGFCLELVTVVFGPGFGTEKGPVKPST